MSLDQETGAGAADVAPELDLNDLDAVAETYLADEDAADVTDAPAEEPADTQQTADETEVPPAAPEGPAGDVLPTEHKFQPFEFEHEGRKIKVESEDELREAFRLQTEFGRQTRRNAAERKNFQDELQKRDEELDLLRQLKKEVGPILDGLKKKPELGDYLNEELGLEKVPDPREIALNDRISKIESGMSRRDAGDRRNNVINVLDVTRREHFGYQASVTPDEVQMVEKYAEVNGVSRDVLYSNPLIAAGVFAVLVGMNAIAPPQMPTDPGAPAKSVNNKVADATNLPPASSGAAPAPKPYSHKGKDPDDVLRDLAELPETEVDDEVLRLMGVESRK